MAVPVEIDTICVYITWLAEGQQGVPGIRKRAGWGDTYSVATSTVDMVISAIKYANRLKGHKIDGKDARLQSVRAGIRREIAKTRTVRKVKPILSADIREMLEMLRPDIPREAQDAALLALGWSGARRRSELVSLDYAKLGDGDDPKRKGYLTIDEAGITITLMVSKTSQDAAATYVVPREHMPAGVKAVENWIQVGGIRPGQALFYGVGGKHWGSGPQCGYRGVSWHPTSERWRVQARLDGKNKYLGMFDDPREAHLAYCKATGLKPQKPHEEALGSRRRMGAGLVANIVKRRVLQLYNRRNTAKGRKKATKEEIAALVAQFSGHSMRAGFVTSAFQADVNREAVKRQTGHKSDSVLSGYYREAELHKNSGLRGIGV